MIKGIVFDFDGLILDTETVWYDSFREAFRQLHLDLPLEDFASYVGTHGADFDRYLKERIGNEELLMAVKRTAKELHREKIQKLDAREGVRTYLEEAKALDMKIGLASSSDRAWVRGFLGQLQLLSFFDAIKTADDVARVKPDPELYLQTIEALQLTPGEAIAFEDSAPGAKAATTAGLHCVIVPNPVTGHLLFERYDLRLTSMAERPLSEIVRELERKASERPRGLI